MGWVAGQPGGRGRGLRCNQVAWLGGGCGCGWVGAIAYRKKNEERAPVRPPDGGSISPGTEAVAATPDPVVHTHYGMALTCVQVHSVRCKLQRATAAPLWCLAWRGQRRLPAASSAPSCAGCA